MGAVDRQNEPEEQPNKPEEEDLTNERKPGEKGRGVWVVCVCVRVYVKGTWP